MYRSNWSFNIPPPGHTPGIWQFKSSRRWGIWKPHGMGGEFEQIASVSCYLSQRLYVTKTWRSLQSVLHWRILEDKIAPLFATGCKREGCKSFAPYLLRSVNRSWGQKRISTKWNNGLGADLTYIDLYRSIEIDQKFVFAILKLWRLPSCIYHLGFCDQSLSTV